MASHIQRQRPGATCMWLSGLLLVALVLLLLKELRLTYLAAEGDGWGQLLQGTTLAKGGASCGLDGMKAYRLSGWREDGVHAQVYGSCDLCGLSANKVEAMLALPHDCQKDVWEGDRWVPLGSFADSTSIEKPTCVIICSSFIPCLPPVALNKTMEQPRWKLPSCLLSMWLRKGTSDGYVVDQIFFDYGSHSISSLGLPPPQQLPISTILDAGANIGLMSLYFATLYPGTIVVSMEASASNYEVLVLNTARFPNIRPLQFALWSSATTLCLVHSGRDPLRPEWGYQVLEKSMVTGGREILDTMQSKSVADVLQMSGLQSFDLIKMDVEGSEGAVFSTSSDTSFLEDSRMVIMELHWDIWVGASEIVYEAFTKHPSWRLASRSGEHELWLAERKEENKQG